MGVGQCLFLHDMWSWGVWRATVWMWAAIIGDVGIVLGVACGLDVEPALQHAKRFVTEAIRHAPERGHGHRPLAHTCATDSPSLSS